MPPTARNNTRHISGYCNRTLPRTDKYDPHQLCPGCQCTADDCPCKTKNQETTTFDTEENTLNVQLT